MGKTIWKYPLRPQVLRQTKFEIKIPKGATVLSAVIQCDIITVFALVDDTIKEEETLTFNICSTGEPINHDDSYVFLGTVVFNEGPHVYHVFYKKS